VVDHIHELYPNSTLFAAGWSLGANILVNYLGEQVRLLVGLHIL
jgi:predicted alpha/beta-fold hydrolase